MPTSLLADALIALITGPGLSLLYTAARHYTARRREPALGQLLLKGPSSRRASRHAGTTLVIHLHHDRPFPERQP